MRPGLIRVGAREAASNTNLGLRTHADSRTACHLAIDCAMFQVWQVSWAATRSAERGEDESKAWKGHPAVEARFPAGIHPRVAGKPMGRR